MSILSFNGIIGFTEIGGLAVKYTNRTGGIAAQGQVVTTASSHDNSVSLVQIDIPNPIGAIYGNDNGQPVADGLEVWVVVAGVANVLFMGNTTRGQFARTLVTADGGAAGQAIAEALPTPPLATDKHFSEIGHVLESRVGPGLAKVNLHFN